MRDAVAEAFITSGRLEPLFAATVVWLLSMPEESTLVTPLRWSSAGLAPGETEAEG